MPLGELEISGVIDGESKALGKAHGNGPHLICRVIIKADRAEPTKSRPDDAAGLHRGGRAVRRPITRLWPRAARAPAPAHPIPPPAPARLSSPVSARLQSTTSPLRSYPGQNSRPSSADQILDLQTTQSDTSARLLQTGDGAPRLSSIEPRTGRRQRLDGFTPPGDDDLLAMFHPVQQGAEPSGIIKRAALFATIIKLPDSYCRLPADDGLGSKEGRAIVFRRFVTFVGELPNSSAGSLLGAFSVRLFPCRITGILGSTSCSCWIFRDGGGSK
jgi:hypothetical protein